MTHDPQEYEAKKRAIFEGMSARGQKRILRLGYENWDPFQEPKDPRQRMQGSSTLEANRLVQVFFDSHHDQESVRDYYRELFALCRGVLEGEARARLIFDFCAWYAKQKEQ